MRWIDIKKELPDFGQVVLVALLEGDSGRYFIRRAYLSELTFNGRKLWVVGGTYCDNEVTHWMPLPEPPERVEEKDTMNEETTEITKCKQSR